MILYRLNNQEVLPPKRRNPSTTDPPVIMWLTLESHLITALANMIWIFLNGLYGPIMFVNMVVLIRVFRSIMTGYFVFLWHGPALYLILSLGPDV